MLCSTSPKQSVERRVSKVKDTSYIHDPPNEKRARDFRYCALVRTDRSKTRICTCVYVQYIKSPKDYIKRKINNYETIHTVTMMNPAATLSLLVLVLVRYSHGFSLPYTQIGGQRYPTNRFLSQDDSNDVMKTEIEEMRKEARRRIEALNTQITHGNSSTTSTSVDVLDQVEKTVAFEPVVAVSNKPVASETERPSYNSKSIARVKKQEVANLLDDTRWKITLNIGREPGKSGLFTLYTHVDHYTHIDH